MKSTNRSRLILSILLLAAIAGCSRQQPESAADATMTPEEGKSLDDSNDATRVRNATAAAAPAAEPVADSAATVAQISSSATTYNDAQRKFIRTAQVEFRVKDVYKSALAIEDVVAAQGGFVVKNEIAAQTRSTQRRPMGDGKLLELAEYTVHGNLVVRVPSDKAQSFLRTIVGQMEFLDRRNFDALDAQFDLLRQQLAYQRSQQAQQALGQAAQQGGKLGQKVDAIQAQGEAMSSRDEALVAEKEFEDRVAFATLNLSLYQTPQIRRTELIDVDAVFEQNSPGFLARLGGSMRAGWYGVVDVFLALIKLWPLWLLLAIAGAVWRRLRKARA